MDAFVEAGGNFVDTADVYSRWARGNPGGVSEEIIGRWMKERGNRDRLVIATKVRGRMWTGPDGEGLSRAHITRAVEDSLRRLQIETIDLYQCHSPDEDTPIEETLTAFADLIASGKVRHVGASNFTAGQLSEALRVAGEKSRPRSAALQPHPRSQRAGNARRYRNPPGFAVLDTLDSVAAAHDTTTAAVALAWQMTKPAVTAPIIGANTPEQLADLLPATDFELTADEVNALETASAGA